MITLKVIWISHALLQNTSVNNCGNFQVDPSSQSLTSSFFRCAVLILMSLYDYKIWLQNLSIDWLQWLVYNLNWSTIIMYSITYWLSSNFPILHIYRYREQKNYNVGQLESLWEIPRRQESLRRLNGDKWNYKRYLGRQENQKKKLKKLKLRSLWKNRPQRTKRDQVSHNNSIRNYKGNNKEILSRKKT